MAAAAAAAAAARGGQARPPTTPQESYALLRRPARRRRPLAPRPLICAMLPPPPPQRVLRCVGEPPPPPHATPYHPHDPPVHPASEPPCSIAGILPHSSPAGRLLISGRSGSSSSGGAAGTIIIFIIYSRRWRVQRVLVLGCSQPRRLHPKRYRLATARGGALPWLWGSDGGLFPHVYMVLFGQRIRRCSTLVENAQCPLFEGERGERWTKRRNLA